ncbi:hypothetical protein AMATHDRAFT_33 [Amanita thiersii Skay4041]|uniref:EamA domain-containing protein n=1 Tax=Amanita thiersii Skay4041 TaxID=703135 RepID=A0A2A9P1H5_9AGAR|nr:hypothetical protein AMATHDRAFT_33 [Amanita thiersii Skay4041]
MPARQDAVRLGGKLAIVLFIATLCAFVSESQLTQYVQTTLGYRRPFFLFYIVHSSLSIIFPLHLFYLCATTEETASSYLKGLSLAITDRLSPSKTTISTTFPYYAFARQLFFMFSGLTFPGLLWFAAISLASISDVTAIWNTNAFFAYILSIKLFHMPWEPKRLFSVLLATFGVAIVVYGGSTHTNSTEPANAGIQTTTVPSAPLAGDLLTLAASIGYGLYQVLYKKYVALPSDPELASDQQYRLVQNDDVEPASYGTSTTEADKRAAVYPPPFGLHPSLVTSGIGFLTLVILWIPLPILHYLEIEHFKLPDNLKTVFAIAGISVSGVIFNTGFMILLGLWGPIITSVGSLLTIVLVSISDVVFGGGVQDFTLLGVIGCSVITAAFSVLAYDMFKKNLHVA